MSFVADPEIDMPVAMQRRNHELNRAALECYELRNAEPDHDRAHAFHEMGDWFLLRAIALTEEWE